VATLVLVRHGESAWNAADVFRGWIDVRLSDRGKQQAHETGQLLSRWATSSRPVSQVSASDP
jgi:2,3-bisphosphoglycerate-dependent phosphoglycerate mutase